MCPSDDHRTLARAILGELIPDPHRGGLDDVIREELVVTALQGSERPRTIVELLSILERFGDVGLQLVEAVRARAELEPDTLLSDLAGRRN